MRRLLPSSLGGRLIAGVSLFTLVALIVTLFVMSHVLERFVTGQIDQRLDNKIVVLASQLRVAGDGTISLDGNADGPPFDEPRHLSFWSVAGPRNALQSRWLVPGAFVPPTAAEVDAMPAPPRPPHGGPPGSHPRTMRGPGPDGIDMHMRVAVRPIAGTPVTILAAAPRRAIVDPLHEALTTVAVTLGALGAALLFAAVLLSRLVLRPLTRLRADVADVRTGRRAMISDAQPFEVRPLVDELNALLAQNAANITRARTHVANLAHGLKTPLATLSLSLPRLGEPAAPLAVLVAGIERRVRHHLGRARAAALDGPVRSQTILCPRLADLLHALAKIYAEKRVVVSLDCPPDATLACELQDVDEIFGNLLDNAFKYTTKRVDCGASIEGSRVIIEIVDDGPGLDAAEIARVLRPGQRLDEDVPGYGFGLPIARELAELYGGSLTLIGREPGGLIVRLDLPRAL